LQNTPEVIYNNSMKAVQEKVEWDKKKIIFFAAGLILLIVMGLVFRNMMVAGQESSNPSQLTTNVKGASTQIANPVSDISKNVQNQINSLKNEAQNINIVDVATSSPQVQKVINDLKAIQDYPKNQLRQTCEKICSGL
jgi:conjugal transfer/entry exclusion protein